MLRWGIGNFVIPHPRILGSGECLINTSTFRLRWLCQASFGCADITDSQTFGCVSATETWVWVSVMSAQPRVWTSVVSAQPKLHLLIMFIYSWSNGGGSSDCTQISVMMIPFASHSLALDWEARRPLITFQEDIHFTVLMGNLKR
jgi:hypothetical protein